MGQRGKRPVSPLGLIWITLKLFLDQLLLCTWRHGGHVVGQGQKHFSPLGPKLYFHVNSSRKNSVVLTPNMVALSRGCKPRIKRLKFIGIWFPERSANFCSVLSGENSTVAITIFCIVCFDRWGRRAWTWWRFKQSYEMCGRLRNQTSV